MSRILAVGLLLCVNGCTSLGYYMQSFKGQMEIISKRQLIGELVLSDETPEALKQKLRKVLQIRDYSVNELALPDNGSYRSYADIGRKYVLWNVFATPEMSLDLLEWCFPIAGCVRYRGYFSKSQAEEFAEQLQKAGNDVYVAGVAAYSTLGWFDDPMLNTVIKRKDPYLAGLIFHELAHQQLYIQDDTAFNEGFAKTVELEGIKRWMKSQHRPDEMQKYNKEKMFRDDFISLLASTSKQLKTVFNSDLNDEDKRSEKKVVYQEMLNNYKALKEKWRGYKAYDQWFSTSLNNAKIASISTYNDQVPAFQAILNNQKGNFQKFYKAVEIISKLSFDDRQIELNKYRTKNSPYGNP